MLSKDAGKARIARALTLDWRQLALALLVFGGVGILIELALLGHYEEPWQWTPLVLVSAGLVASAWIARRPGRLSLRVFRWLMAGHLAGGAVGLFLHFKVNMEDALELRPDGAGWALVWDTLTGGDIPSLAPGTMFQLGLLGLLVSWRHPGRSSTSEPEGH